MKTNVTGIRGTVRTWHQTVRAVATANSAASGLLTIDGVTLVANDRVLLTAQTSGVDNGVYVAAAGAWTRAVDMLPGSTVEPTAHIPVSEGTTHEDSTYQITTDGPITVGTDAVTFAKIALGLAALVDDLTPVLGGNLDCNTKSVTNAGELGVGTAAPDRKLDVLDSAGVSDAAVPQLRLTHTDGVNFAEVGSTADGYFFAQPSGSTGYSFFRGSTNSYIVIQELTLTGEPTPASFPDNGTGMKIGVQAKIGYIWLDPAGSISGAAIKIGVEHSTLVIDNAGGTKNVQVVGNATLGNAGTDEHTLNGTLNLDSAPADNTCSGTTATFTAGETVVRGDVVYYKPADSMMWKAVADATATARAVAIAAEDITGGNPGRYLLRGFIQDVGTFAGAYVAGDVVYTNDTAGPPTNTAPTDPGDFVQVIGWAVDANTLYFDPGSTIIELV